MMVMILSIVVTVVQWRGSGNYDGDDIEYWCSGEGEW